MPVLGQHDMIKTYGEAIDNRHHRVRIANRKRPTGAEIVLHVDDQQQVIVTERRIHDFSPQIEANS
jgi:hypothetical protein